MGVIHINLLPINFKSLDNYFNLRVKSLNTPINCFNSKLNCFKLGVIYFKLGRKWCRTPWQILEIMSHEDLTYRERSTALPWQTLEMFSNEELTYRGRSTAPPWHILEMLSGEKLTYRGRSSRSVETMTPRPVGSVSEGSPQIADHRREHSLLWKRDRRCSMSEMFGVCCRELCYCWNRKWD